jgi:hypothetical protein
MAYTKRQKQLQDGIYDLITHKADGLCMDVPAERRKMAALISQALGK